MGFDLEFEKPLAELEKRITGLEKKGEKLKKDDQVLLQDLQKQLQDKVKEIYSSLTPWQQVQVARHPDRAHSSDYLKFAFEDFFELHGDRRFSDDRAILAGLAKLNGQTVMVIGHEKGRDTRERQERNFGMPHPEGYRKAIRLFEQAEKFHFPVICFIDTPGAYPGLGAEERGQSQAIAESLYRMINLQVPIISVVIGEGGSGGALAIGIADRVLMLEHSVYTVVSPEAAGSILWRDTALAPQAAEAMKITAEDLYKLRLIDGIIPEPLGGAHSNHVEAANLLKASIENHLGKLQTLDIDEMLQIRYEKFRSMGQFKIGVEV